MNSKTFLKASCVFILTLLFAGNLHGQSDQAVQQSFLMNKAWVWRYEGKSAYAINRFTDKKMISTVIYGQDKAEIAEDYYLSDSIVSEFQPDMVGKCARGKYLVTLSGKKPEQTLGIFELVKISDNHLQMTHLKSGTVLEYQVEDIP